MSDNGALNEVGRPYRTRLQRVSPTSPNRFTIAGASPTLVRGCELEGGVLGGVGKNERRRSFSRFMPSYLTE